MFSISGSKVNCQIICPAIKTPLKRKKKCRALDIEKKESYSWLEGVERTTKLMAGSKTKIVTVADREADIYEFIRWIARLGGFLARKGDGDPGIITIWRGWQRLTDIAEDYFLFKGRPTCG